MLGRSRYRQPQDPGPFFVQEHSRKLGVYIDVFEQSILLPDPSNKTWSFLASVTVELIAASIIVLIPLATINRLPDFHWKSVNVTAPPKRLETEPVVRRSASLPAGASILHRAFIRLTPGSSVTNQTESSGLFSVEPPLDGIALGERPSPVGISLDNFAAITVRVRPPEPPKHLDPPSGPLRVGGEVQMAKLVKRVIPEYPPLAKTARVSGVVHLIGVIAKDGTIQNLQLISGHPLLARAAIQAVRQWVYLPTLLNGQAVEVIAPIDVNFTLGR